MAQITIPLTDRLLTSSYQARHFLDPYMYVKTTPSTVTSATQSITVPPASAINWVRVYFTKNSPSHGTALHQVIVDGEVAHAGSVIGNGSLLSKTLFTPGNHTLAFRFKSGTANTTSSFTNWIVNTSQLNITGASLVIDYEGPDTGGDAPPSAVKSDLALNVGGVKCGNSIRFLIQNQSPGVYHKALIGIVGLTAITEIVPKGASFFDFEVPYGWQTYISPNGTARYAADGVYARLYTYRDQARTDLIGYNDKGMYIAISDDNVPVISEFSDTLIPLYTDAALSGYIQRYSEAQLTALADGQFGATIASYKFISGAWSKQVLASELTGDELPSALTPVITQSGTLSLSLEVTDTRRRKSTQDITIQVAPYTDPSLISPKAYRSSDTGAAAALGEYLTLQTGATYTDLSGVNTASILARVYQKGTTPPTWDGAGILTLTGSVPTTISGISKENSYTVDIRVKDKLSEALFTIDIGTAKALLTGLAGVAGAAIGKFADTPNILDVSFPKGRMDLKPIITAYPGLIITTNTAQNPGEIYGGTWVMYGKGRTLVGVDPDNPAKAIVNTEIGADTANADINATALIGVSGTSIWVKRKPRSYQADGKGTLAGGVVANSDNLTSGIEVVGSVSISTEQAGILVYHWLCTAI